MADDLNVDICVIGAGSGGLTVAAGASQMGASTVLIEKGKMGGDCLNYGCVPSKALLAAGHAAAAMRAGQDFGIECGDVSVNMKRVFGYVHDTIAAIEPNDSVERFKGLGVTVIQGAARFSGPSRVEAGGRVINARRFVVATGSLPFVPPIAGLDGVPYHTNETIFYADRLPEHLIVVGGGPIGIEMAQAHRHLGARVTMLELFTIMPKDDPELVGILRCRLEAEGIDIHEGAKIARVEKSADGISVYFNEEGGKTKLVGSDLLIAAGRRPNVDGLGLDEAGIRCSAKGIVVDRRLRTTNKRVYAIGDVVGGYQFTHVASSHAGVVIRNALFRLPCKANTRIIPWVTFTAPELAQVGLTDVEAKEQRGNIRILRWPFHENDRAQTEGKTVGLVKAVTTPKGRILGCGIVGSAAGELIHAWVLAMSKNLKIGAMASMVAPYPTLGEVSKRAAGSFYTPTLFSERTRWIVRFLSRFG